MDEKITFSHRKYAITIIIGCHVIFLQLLVFCNFSKVTMGFCSHMCHLSMKEGSLFCFVLFYSYEIHHASNRVLDGFRKLSTRKGPWAWFHDAWTCGAKVEY